MIHKETREREVIIKQHDVIVAVTCDLCKQRVNGAVSNFDGEVTWEDTLSGGNVILKTAMYYNRTEYWGCDGDGETKETTVHICANCFTTRLVPWLKSQGTEPEQKEFSF